VRGRGEVNSFNVLQIDGDRVTVERLDWNTGTARFARVSAEEFRRSDAGWVPRPG
jgi:hypothetical protein